MPAHASGWAVGGNGLVIRSADGGQTWTSSSPATGTLNAVHFVSDQDGWAVGNGGIAVHTTDGGDHWTQTSPGTQNLNGVFFIDAGHGWMVGDGGKVLRTTNGGATWVTSTPTTAALYDVFFTDSNLGWAVGKGVVLRTTDGGSMWSHASPTTATLRGVYFADAQTGIAVGSGGVVLRSVNGGTTFTSSVVSSSDLYSCYLASATRGWAVGETGAILTTTNGTSWTTQRVSSATYRSVHFVDDMNGWAVGSGGSVAQTSDGGGRWDVSYPAAQTLNGVFFASIPAGIAVTVDTDPAGLAFTVDGVAYSAAHTFRWDPASSHTIGTTTPQSGGAGTQYVWSSWSNGGAITQTVAPTGNTVYTAHFATQFHLSMQPAANGTTSPASGWFDAGATVAIAATPDPGFGFNGWSGVGSGAYTGWINPAQVEMNAPITETPSFGTSVTVVVTGVPGGAEFVVDGATYASQQTFTWPPGSTHTLDVVSPQMVGSDTRRVFQRWSDAGSANHDISPVSNGTYTVTYKTQCMLTTQTGSGGSVSPAPGWWDAGTPVTISASADSGYYFVSWSGSGPGSYSGSSNPRTITVNGPIVQQAQFAPGQAPVYPAELTLLPSAPNPAHSQTSVRFGLPRDSDVSIELFDVQGRRVFEDRVSGMLRGWQDYLLDVSSARSPLRSGIYFVRVTAAGAARTGRLVVLR
ncbi:MAG TPA: YCF48-related protein [Candidatus Krumholzibacteria bacterium]|nr:YCF48-related protein [Candidatus Krumholzibacteria bacterium]